MRLAPAKAPDTQGICGGHVKACTFLSLIERLLIPMQFDWHKKHFTYYLVILSLVRIPTIRDYANMSHILVRNSKKFCTDLHLFTSFLTYFIY